MPNEVKVPLLGEVPKGGLFAGMLAAVGVGGYMLYKHMKDSGTAAATSATTAAAGYGAAAYGYAAAAYGYGYADYPYGYGYMSSPYGYGYGPYGYGFGAYGDYGGLGYGEYGYGSAPVTATNNQMWVQNALTALTNQGYSNTSVLTALSAYIGGKPVQQGSSEDQTIQAAIALEGYPPQPGAAGYPPAVNYHGASSSSGGQVAVPNIVGMTLPDADAALSKAGLTYNKSPAPAKTNSWRKVTAQTPKAGTMVNKGTYVNITWVDVRKGSTTSGR